jgi:hypothetical protein
VPTEEIAFMISKSRGAERRRHPCHILFTATKAALVTPERHARELSHVTIRKDVEWEGRDGTKGGRKAR